MTWRPGKLSRERMEERRREGARLLRGGKLSDAAIARQLGVSRTAVEKWDQALKDGGLRGLRRRKATGRPPKLDRKQQSQLKRLLKRGAFAAGFESNRWTLGRVRQLIKQEFDVAYHRNYLNRLLRKLGLSPQVPLPRAMERDEELVRAWIERDWPRIKKGAAQRLRNSVF